jgi:hypothetical protein
MSSFVSRDRSKIMIDGYFMSKSYSSKNKTQFHKQKILASLCGMVPVISAGQNLY